MMLNQPGHENHRKGIWYCTWCGGKFIQRITDIRTGRAAKYCSRSCQAHAQNNGKDFTGPNNPNWKGGISKNKVHYAEIQKQRYPERVLCRKTTLQAIRSGKIKRGPCKVCGLPNAHAHHSDYLIPFKIEWYCKAHHLELHRNMGTFLKENFFNEKKDQKINHLTLKEEITFCKTPQCNYLAGYSGYCKRHNPSTGQRPADKR